MADKSKSSGKSAPKSGSLEFEADQAAQEAAAAQEQRIPGSFDLSSNIGTDFSRVRKAIQDEKQISNLMMVNRVLILLIIVLIAYFEMMSGKIFGYTLSILTPPPPVQQTAQPAKAPEPKNLPPEKEMVKYPFEDYVLEKSQANPDGQSENSEQPSQ